jgi:hypothetical protein
VSVLCVAAPLLQLVLEKHLSLKQLKFFVIDECDKVLEKHGECLLLLLLVTSCTATHVETLCRAACLWVLSSPSAALPAKSPNMGAPCRCADLLPPASGACLSACRRRLCCADMRGDVQAIFKETPHDKQVMMFSATLAKDIRGVCKKFMNKVRAPWKAAADPLPRPAAGDAGLAPVAVLAVSRSSPSTPSRASMQACFRQHQRPPGQVAPQPTTTLAAGRRGAVAEVAVPQPHSQLTSSPCWAAQAPPQLAAVVAG